MHALVSGQESPIIPAASEKLFTVRSQQREHKGYIFPLLTVVGSDVRSDPAAYLIGPYTYFVGGVDRATVYERLWYTEHRHEVTWLNNVFCQNTHVCRLLRFAAGKM